MLRKPSTVFFKISRLGRFRSQFPVSRFPNAGSSKTSNFPLGHFPFPISHFVCSTNPHPISHFPFPTWSLASLVGEQFPVSRFQRATPPLVWKHTFNFPFPISHSLGIGGVGNERSKDKVKDQFPEGDNESGEFPISHCPISNGKLGMCITLYSSILFIRVCGAQMEYTVIHIYSTQVDGYGFMTVTLSVY